MSLGRKKWYLSSSDKTRKSHLTQSFQRQDHTLYLPRMSVSQKLIINTSHNYRAFGVRLLQFGTEGQSPLTLEPFALQKTSLPEKHEIIFVLNSDKDLKLND